MSPLVMVEVPTKGKRNGREKWGYFLAKWRERERAWHHLRAQADRGRKIRVVSLVKPK